MTDAELFDLIDLVKGPYVGLGLVALDRDGKRIYAHRAKNGIMVLQSYEDLCIYAETLRVDAQEEPSMADLFSDTPLRLNSIFLGFADREMLDKQDYALIKSLGRSYRGKGQWPILRSMRCYRMPWNLTPEDRELLGMVLRALGHLRNGKILVTSRTDMMVLSHSEGDGWTLAQSEPMPETKVPQFAQPAAKLKNELVGARIRKLPKKQSVWAVTVQCYPMPVRADDGGAPCFTQMLLIVDEAEDTVVDVLVAENYESDYQNLADEFLMRMVEHGRPGRVRFANDRAAMLLSGICAQVGISTERSDDQPMLADALHSMQEYFHGNTGENKED